LEAELLVVANIHTSEPAGKVSALRGCPGGFWCLVTDIGSEREALPDTVPFETSLVTLIGETQRDATGEVLTNGIP
jgi:hypothetical protein